MTDRPLTPDLLGRIAGSSREARLHAVDDLAELAGGGDLGLARTARAALRALADDDDSRRVSEAAAAAWQRTSIGLDPPRLDFGRVPPGTPRMVADIVVTGPPLARTAMVAAAGPGLRATLIGDVLRVSWLPGAGFFDGSVSVTGPAGTVTLPVTGDVTAGPLSGAALAGRRKAAAGVGALRTDFPPAGPPAARARLAVPVALVTTLLMLVGLGLGVRLRTTPPAMPLPATALRAARTVPGPPTERLAVSTAKPSVVATVAVGDEPEGVAVAPDGRTVYVAEQGARTLSVIDARTRAVTSVALRNTARFVAVSRDGRRVYVSMYEPDKSGSGVAVVDAATREVTGYMETGTQPYDLAVAPDGRLWVPIHDGARVDIFTAGDQKPAGRVRVAANPHSVGFASDGVRAFTPDHESNRVSVIDMRTDQLVESLPVGEAPHNLDVSPDGRTVVVACFGADAVDIIDAVTLRRRGPFPVGRKPQSVAISADSSRAYVVNEADNTVSVLEIRTGAVTATVPVGRSPRTVAVSPDGKLAYVTNGDDDTVSVLKLGQSR